MADLGDLLGSLMSGVIRARRVADEQTAALAEYYKSNPLLEGLSVPRIRIPELTVDMPFVVDNYVGGESGEMADPATIAAAANVQLKSTLARNNIKVSQAFHGSFMREVKKQLALVKQTAAPVMTETIARKVQDALAETLIKTKTTVTASEKDLLASDLRAKVSAIGVARKESAPRIDANIKTADVKEQASSANVVRLKITLKEEGLEWGVQASESGGVVRTLQPE